jgi:hypothetical protein
MIGALTIGFVVMVIAVRTVEEVRVPSESKTSTQAEPASASQTSEGATNANVAPGPPVTLVLEVQVYVDGAQPEAGVAVKVVELPGATAAVDGATVGGLMVVVGG